MLVADHDLFGVGCLHPEALLAERVDLHGAARPLHRDERSRCGALPRLGLAVLLAQDEPGCNTTPLGELTTNARGNGNLHFSTERIPGTTKFFVGVLSGGELFANAAVELD